MAEILSLRQTTVMCTLPNIHRRRVIVAMVPLRPQALNHSLPHTVLPVAALRWIGSLQWREYQPTLGEMVMIISVVSYGKNPSIVSMLVYIC